MTPDRATAADALRGTYLREPTTNTRFHFVAAVRLSRPFRERKRRVLGKWAVHAVVEAD